jgi:hypothetical protein
MTYSEDLGRLLRKETRIASASASYVDGSYVDGLVYIEDAIFLDVGVVNNEGWGGALSGDLDFLDVEEHAVNLCADLVGEDTEQTLLIWIRVSDAQGAQDGTYQWHSRHDRISRRCVGGWGPNQQMDHCSIDWCGCKAPR